MQHYLSTTLTFALTQLKRNLRDPVTLLVLLAIPMLLLFMFGAFFRNTNNISIKVAIVNNSETAFAGQFEESLKGVKVFKLPDKELTVEAAREEMNKDALEGIIELPPGFGAPVKGVPGGKVQLYYDQADTQTAEIVASVMRSVVEGTNQQLTGASTPIVIERKAVNVTQASMFDNFFAMFTGMAIMMVGIFGVASSIPADKKAGILRRLRATPLRAGQVLAGTTMCFAVIGVLAVGAMTAMAIIGFDFNMRGDWLTYGAYVAVSIALMLGFGLAIGGFAKNSTQADVLGQIVFMISLAFSGIWFPRALLPEWLQNVTAFLPLTPVVEGIRDITTANASLLALGPELAIMGGWIVVVYVVGAKMFKWES